MRANVGWIVNLSTIYIELGLFIELISTSWWSTSKFCVCFSQTELSYFTTASSPSLRVFFLWIIAQTMHIIPSVWILSFLLCWLGLVSVEKSTRDSFRATCLNWHLYYLGIITECFNEITTIFLLNQSYILIIYQLELSLFFYTHSNHIFAISCQQWNTYYCWNLCPKCGLWFITL